MTNLLEANAVESLPLAELFPASTLYKFPRDLHLSPWLDWYDTRFTLPGRNPEASPDR